MRGRWCCHISPDTETRQREENSFRYSGCGFAVGLYIEAEDAIREVKGYV